MKKAFRKRYVRNTVMLAMILALSACSCFTYAMAKEDATSKAIDLAQAQFGEMPSGNFPDFGNNQNDSQTTDGEQATDNNQQPPEMPNGGTQEDAANGATDGEGTSESANGPSRSENGPSKGGNQQMPNGGENSGRPQLPGESGDSSAEGTTDSQQQPELPSDGTQQNGDAQTADGEDTTKSANGPSRSENGPDNGGNQQLPSGDNQNMTPPDSNGQMPDMGGSASAQISAPYIAALAAENLMITAILVYLILSGFNKRGFKKTLKSTKNAIIFAITVALLTGAITFAQFAISGRTEVPFDGRPDMSQSQTLPDGGERTTEEQTEGEATTEEDGTEASGANQANIEFTI